MTEFEKGILKIHSDYSKRILKNSRINSYIGTIEALKEANNEYKENIKNLIDNFMGAYKPCH